MGRRRGISGFAARHLHWHETVGATHAFTVCALTVDVGDLGLGAFTACEDFPTFTGQDNVQTCRQWGTLMGSKLLVSWKESRVGKWEPGQEQDWSTRSWSINTFFFWPGNDKKKSPFCYTLAHGGVLQKPRVITFFQNVAAKWLMLHFGTSTTIIMHWRNGSELVIIDQCAHIAKRRLEYSPLNCGLHIAWANKKIYPSEPLSVSLLTAVPFEHNAGHRPRSSKACSGMYVHA